VLPLLSVRKERRGVWWPLSASCSSLSGSLGSRFYRMLTVHGADVVELSHKLELPASAESTLHIVTAPVVCLLTPNSRVRVLIFDRQPLHLPRWSPTWQCPHDRVATLVLSTICVVPCFCFPASRPCSVFLHPFASPLVPPPANHSTACLRNPTHPTRRALDVNCGLRSGRRHHGRRQVESKPAAPDTAKQLPVASASATAASSPSRPSATPPPAAASAPAQPRYLSRASTTNFFRRPATASASSVSSVTSTPSPSPPRHE
jgi:hypothetical protein